jgi:hypothetical protein
MWVDMLTMYEDGGRPIGGWRHGANRTRAHGMVRYGQEFVDEIRDKVSVCSLDQGPDKERLKLYRASLLHIASGEMRITGLEYDQVFRKYTAQTWDMRVLAPERCTHEDALSLIRSITIGSRLSLAALRNLVRELEQDERVCA